MPSTYDRIARQTVTGSAVASVEFSSIPSTYTDLVVVVTAQQTGTPTATDAFVTLNGNGSSIYSRTVLYGDGTAASSSRNANFDRAYFALSPQSARFATVIYDFNNYSNTTTNKSMLMRYGDAGLALYSASYLFRSTSAISIIAFTASDRMGAGVADSWSVGSTFTLYGIKAA